MPVYIRDLADQIMLPNDDKRRKEYLRCSECGAEYSASKGDYWNLDSDQKMRCSSGHEPTDLELVVSHTIIERLK